MDAVIRSLVLLAAVLFSGCIGESPLQQQRDALGPDDAPLDGLHRPGQPCLVCHGPDDTQGQQFAIAGTIYEHAADTVGMNHAWVTIVDATGAAYQVRSNEAGNIMIQVRPDLVDAPTPYEGGITLIPNTPVFPLQVASVSDESGTVVNQMLSQIHREGSCAGCHTGDSSATSPGRVWLAPP